MSYDEGVSFSLELNVGPAYEEVRRLQTALSRSLSFVRRLSGSENIDAFCDKCLRAVAIANQLRLALAALQAARMAAGDPIAWIMTGIAGAEALISGAEFAVDLL